VGFISSPPPVLAILAVTSRHDEAFAWSHARWQALLDDVALCSNPFEFVQTDYYTATMGDHLRKQFLVATRLCDPADLPGWKVLTNQWEEEYQAANNWPESRPLNLDPGYLAQDKLVLASTKNHAHRLYLGKGIYGEFTLQYRGKKWCSCPWTYPDYQQPVYHAFFTQARDYLRERAKVG
jgi:hypothetical protein